jgi:hypothetical protein
MDEAKLADELNELVNQFGGTSDPTTKRLAIMAKQAEDNQKELQKSVDFLRVCIKYMLLDIEATRRENEYLRKLLQDKDQTEE